MKKAALILMSIMLIFAAVGCTAEIDTPTDTTDVPEASAISTEEQQRVDLYVAAMKGAFNEENGGSGFIAVKLSTLTDLSDNGKEEVLKELKSLSDNVYDFESVKNDSSKFQLDEKGNLVRTLDGTLLYIHLKEYSSNKAVITGVSWFGNLGAVFPEYEATYKNGAWVLKLISMAIS
jgi:hypothetical protein